MQVQHGEAPEAYSIVRTDHQMAEVNEPEGSELAAGSRVATDTGSRPVRENGPAGGSGPAHEMVSRSVGGAAAQAVVGLLARAAGLLTTLVVTHFVSTQECGNANLAMI